MTKLYYKNAEAVIESLSPHTVKRYLTYWNKIKPKDWFQYYLRWVFAYTSVRTQWKQNVRLYQSVKNLGTDYKFPDLYRTVSSTYGGMVEVRTKGIWNFYDQYLNHQSIWWKNDNETFVECRDRLMKKTFGLGITKVSFVMEMCYPKECTVVCLDTHLRKLYGIAVDDSFNGTTYRKVEQHWVECCNARNIPCSIARHIYWDRLHNKTNTRYWSYVFE